MDSLGARIANLIAEKDYSNGQAVRNAVRQCGLLSGSADESSSQGAILDTIRELNSSKKVCCWQQRIEPVKTQVRLLMNAAHESSGAFNVAACKPKDSKKEIVMSGSDARMAIILLCNNFAQVLPVHPDSL